MQKIQTLQMLFMKLLFLAATNVFISCQNILIYLAYFLITFSSRNNVGGVKINVLGFDVDTTLL